MSGLFKDLVFKELVWPEQMSEGNDRRLIQKSIIGRETIIGTLAFTLNKIRKFWRILSTR